MKAPYRLRRLPESCGHWRKQLIIEKVELKNFRSYKELSLELAPGVNLFRGRNGQGKTNLLEALYILASSKSFRSRNEAELINFDADFCSIKALFRKSQGAEREMEARWLAGEGTLARRFLKNGVKVEHMGEFLTEAPISLFVPQDLALVQQGPAFRRRYFDILLCKTSSRYFADLLRFQKILRQRNELLRKSHGSAEARVWDMQYIGAAIKVIEARLKAIGDLSAKAAACFAALAPGGPPFSMHYRSSFPCDPEEAARLLRGKAADEQRRGLTLYGPHRDDIELSIGELSLRRFGSQGQQRSAALALRLGEADFLTGALNEPSVIMLDDCFSELDDGRCQRLLEIVRRFGQVLVTTADSVSYGSDIAEYRISLGEAARI